MAISVKILLTLACCFLLSLTSAEEKTFTVINAGGPDVPFREILIERSMQKDAFSCTVTQENFESALKKLADGKADFILVKKAPDELKTLPADMTVYRYAVTPVLTAVNLRSKLEKISVSDLQKIWNNDYSSWSVFDEKNVFSIHRFGMRLDDASFRFVKNFLSLHDNATHFPLETSQQIITMTAANPNAISIFVFEKDLDFSKVKLLQLTDDSGKNINMNMSHSAIFLKKNQQKIINFLKVKKAK